LLHPQLYRGEFIAKNCNLLEIFELDMKRSKYRDMPETPVMRTRHSKLLTAALWRKIRELALVAGRVTPSVVRHLDFPSNAATPATSTQEEEDVPVIPARQRTTMSDLGYGSPASQSAETPPDAPSPVLSLGEQVDTEIRRWRSLSDVWKHDNSLRRLSGTETAIEWWVKWGERERFPCLTKVALALFALLPGSGALECDIRCSCFKDIVQPKRASLSAGTVEMYVVVGQNKDLHELDTPKMKPLRENWEACIPKRPSSPVGYHDNEESHIPYENEADDMPVDPDSDASTGCESDLIEYDTDPNEAL
jgi:hypothetical protein